MGGINEKAKPLVGIIQVVDSTNLCAVFSSKCNKCHGAIGKGKPIRWKEDEGVRCFGRPRPNT